MRQMVVVGSQRMVQYEDTSADDSVRIYDRGLDFSEPPANFGEYRLTYRTGDMVAPQIEAASRSAWSSRTSPRRSARAPRRSPTRGWAWRVVLCLEALEKSLHEPTANRSPVRSADDVRATQRV